MELLRSKDCLFDCILQLVIRCYVRTYSKFWTLQKAINQRHTHKTKPVGYFKAPEQRDSFQSNESALLQILDGLYLYLWVQSFHCQAGVLLAPGRPLPIRGFSWKVLPTMAMQRQMYCWFLFLVVCNDHDSTRCKDALIIWFVIVTDLDQGGDTETGLI